MTDVPEGFLVMGDTKQSAVEYPFRMVVVIASVKEEVGVFWKTSTYWPFSGLELDE